jgi:Short C-terminal domain
MLRRRRPLLRAAVVGGGAYAVGRHAGNRAAGQAQQVDDQNAQIDTVPQQASAPPPEAAAAPSLLDQLNQLDALHQQGALTDNEFTAAKAKLLGT